MTATGTTGSGSVWFAARRPGPPDDALSRARPGRDETTTEPPPRADIQGTEVPAEKASGGATSPELPRFVLEWPGDGVRMAFRLIPAGNFRMGARGYRRDEEPVHGVRIAEPFWMAETPVTQAQFGLFTRAMHVKHENHFNGRPEHPAENMSWHEAVTFCDWLTRERGAGAPEGWGLFCLPTEAEWEYACRAGSETEYYAGDGEAALQQVGWFDEELEGGSTHAVALKPANAFGLFDLHGNVWEWCHDVWEAGAYRGRVDGAPDAGWQRRRDAGLASLLRMGQARVVRGGSWFDSASGCRSACRYWYTPGDRVRYYGFRVCLVRGPAARKETETEATGAGGRGTRPEADGAAAERASAEPRHQRGRT